MRIAAMNKDRILILGAGIMQGPAILTAHEMGLETVVIDADPDAPMAGKADRFEKIDLKDKENIEIFARTLLSNGGLAGVMTAGTDFSASVAWVAEKLDLPGISYKTALLASDKEKMRHCFREAGLPSPNFTTYSEENIKNQHLMETELPFPFPVVVKPVDNMGSRGCCRVDRATELQEAVQTAMTFSRSGRVIVEEYMEGPEFSVDAILYQGKVTICGLADRHIFFPPYFIEMGHTMPTLASSKDQEALLDVFIRGIQALGIDNGAAKGDIKLTARGPMIGEIAARLSGGYMSGWTYPYSSGANPARGAICAALGRKPQGLNPTQKWTSAERAFISIPGIVQSLSGLEEARAVPGIKDLFLLAKPGSPVSFPQNNVSKAGNVISAAPGREEAIQAAEEAAQKVLIRLICPNADTEAFLAPGSGTAAIPIFPPPAYNADSSLLEQLNHIHPDTISVAGCIYELKELNIIPFPAFLQSDLSDYIGRSPKESLELVRKLSGLALPLKTSAGPVLGREFWSALVRGGYQGAVYHIDSLFARKPL